METNKPIDINGPAVKEMFKVNLGIPEESGTPGKFCRLPEFDGVMDENHYASNLLQL